MVKQASLNISSVLVQWFGMKDFSWFDHCCSRDSHLQDLVLSKSMGFRSVDLLQSSESPMKNRMSGTINSFNVTMIQSRFLYLCYDISGIVRMHLSSWKLEWSNKWCMTLRLFHWSNKKLCHWQSTVSTV